MQAGGRNSLLFLGLLLLAGCKHNNDVLESELRHRETLYRDALDEQRKAECRIDALQREVESLRHGPAKMAPEQAALAFGVKRITLGRSTGGYDKDNCPGDELLQVIVEPRDCDEHVVKAPGTLHVFALEITPQGLKVPISSWEISPENLRQNWKQGLLSTGYTLLLPWQQFPHTEMVRVIARLTVADGRVYEADKDVRVHIVAGAPSSRLPDVPVGPAPPTSLPPLDSLPPPRLLPAHPAPEPTGPLLPPPSTSLTGVRVRRPVPLPEP
jgi:hypothetical protein